MECQPSTTFRNVILDIDGVIWISGAPTEGAATLLDTLRRHNIQFCFLTNDCTASKAKRQRILAQAGVVATDQIVTPVDVTREWLKETKANAIMYLGVPNALPELTTGVLLRDEGPVDAVVVGDLFAHYDRHLLERAASAVMDGAALVAMQRNAFWSDGKRQYVDNGFWVAGFEYVTARKAVVMGKPNALAYVSAMKLLDGTTSLDHSLTAFVSDDIATDLRGAKDVGLTTVYFGSQKKLPQWIDYSARDICGLISALIGHCHD
jgi:HAD superfamily hydrolase (TIGR01450 family)